MDNIQSIFQFAESVSADRFEPLRAFYEVTIARAVRLEMNDAGWEEAAAVFHQPRSAVAEQHLVTARDRHFGPGAIFNPLRSNRFKQPSGPPAADVIEQQRLQDGCRWCEPSSQEFADDFGTVTSLGGRICARANWARAAVVSGIVYGDARMHNLLRLSKNDFVGLFVAAEQYMRCAQRSMRDAGFFLAFMNGGPKSAAGVAHAHLQVVGRDDRHFGYAEQVRARCPSGYWSALESIHDDLGLRIYDGASAAWVSIAPIKERDLVITSPTLELGASFIFRILQALYDTGTNNFTLAAIPSPSYIAHSGDAQGFGDWPSVLWRLVDRGDMRARHSDTGGAELFGSAVIAADPWLVARALRDRLK